MENQQVLFNEHFKIYVSLKDKIIFENELKNQGIEYYSDFSNQPEFENGIRYFIQDIDREKVDAIFKKNNIIASTETILISDYQDLRKIYTFYLKIGLIISLAIIAIIIIEYFFKSK